MICIHKKYFINENGEIFSKQKGNIKKLKTAQNGKYERVIIRIDGKPKNVSIHRLVAKAFIPNPENKETVNHKDGNKFNNNVKNLEWATQQENQRHADLTGLNKVKGVCNGTFKKWFYTKDNITHIVDNETIKDFCDRLNQQSNYSNVKKWCRQNHTLSRGFFNGYTFGYEK